MPKPTILFKAYGANEEQRLVFGLASVSLTADGQTYTDLQADQIEPAELEKAFYAALEDGNILGDTQHNHVDGNVLVEQFVVTAEKMTAVLKAFGVEADLSGFKGVGVWVGYRIRSEKVWNDVKSGKLTGFSIEATADRVAA